MCIVSIETPTKPKPQMDLTLKSLISHPFHTLPLLLCFAALFSLSSVKPISDYSTLVYKKCANQTFTTPTQSHIQQTLSSLFQELISHSSQSKFFKHTEADHDDMGISGLFQCRGDISNEECYSCVNALPNLSNTLCADSVAARVQLHGCYMQYELDGVNSDSSEFSSNHNLLHKACGDQSSSNGVVVGGGGGFEEMRDAAFAALESGIVKGGGFYKTRYESVEVMAECEVGLGDCECGECVSHAVQLIDEGECRGAVSGQIYLEQCFFSFIYHPPENRRDGRGKNGKSMAIIVGGAAALFFGFIFFLFLKSRAKKDDDD